MLAALDLGLQNLMFTLSLMYVCVVSLYLFPIYLYFIIHLKLNTSNNSNLGEQLQRNKYFGLSTEKVIFQTVLPILTNKV